MPHQLKLTGFISFEFCPDFLESDAPSGTRRRHAHATEAGIAEAKTFGRVTKRSRPTSVMFRAERRIPVTDITSARFAHSTALYVALRFARTELDSWPKSRTLFLRNASAGFDVYPLGVSACRRELSSASRLHSSERTVQCPELSQVQVSSY